MALNITDRILTVVVTATLTSAVWIVAGGSLIKNASDQAAEDSVRPAVAAPSPTSTAPIAEEIALGEVPPSESDVAEPLDSGVVSQLDEAEIRELMVPVLNVRPSDLTDTFADSRAGGDRLHEAIDIMAPKGTSVVAAAPGTIEKLFRSDAGGKTIYVRSKDRETIHYYAHMDEYAPGLQEGQRVRRGSTARHCGKHRKCGTRVHRIFTSQILADHSRHAEWWEPAVSVNPYPLLYQALSTRQAGYRRTPLPVEIARTCAARVGCPHRSIQFAQTSFRPLRCGMATPLSGPRVKGYGLSPGKQISASPPLATR